MLSIAGSQALAAKSLRSIVSIALGLGFILASGMAYAQNKTPGGATGCSLNANADAQVNADAKARFGANPRYLTSQGNFTGPGSSGGGGTSVTGTEASTTMVAELVAQRRVQEALSCPIGYTRINGSCQPERRTVTDERASRSLPKTGSMTSLTGKTPSSSATSKTDERKLTPQTDIIPALSSNAVWSEAFYDYERRTGLGTTQAPADRTQQTFGMVFGADRTLRSGDTQLVLGALGSLSSTKQSFNSSSSAIQNTTYTIDLFQQGVATYQPGDVYDYVFPMTHAFSTFEQQTLKGGGVGLTASVSRGGFFADGLFKADFLTLKRTTLASDAYLATLNVNSFEQKGQGKGQDGCINVVNNNGLNGPELFPQDPYSFSGLQTFLNTFTQSTTAANFVFAETFGYHFDLRSGYWVEPLVGAIYTFSAYGSNAAMLGLQDGQDLRLQAGLRLGASKLVGDRGIWTASLTEIVYSDVLIRGYVTNADGFSAGYLAADQGKIRLQSILTSKLSLQNGLSFFLECQGRVGNNYYGYGGRAGARFEF